MPPPRPVDAERQAAAGPAERPRLRPSPFPRPRHAGGATEPAEANIVADAPLAGAAAPEEAAAEDTTPEEVAEEIAALEEAGVLPAAPATDVWDLVHRAQQGDAEAFGGIYDRYVRMVFRYVYSRVGDRALAEDVTSETFVRALRRIDSLSFQGRDVGAWLVTIARNIVRDHVKSSRYRLEVTTADMRDADRATDGPEDAVVQHLTNQQLLACVQQLGSEQQECIVLRFLHGLSVSETAAIMGKKDGAIKALQHRAVRRLAGLLPEGLR
jgi:RNA polymerase sigma-70 factor (TIGR02952 family)